MILETAMLTNSLQFVHFAAALGCSMTAMKDAQLLISAIWGHMAPVGAPVVQPILLIFYSKHFLKGGKWGPGGLSRECVLRIPMRVVKGD